jgi:hypothetical protein
MAMRPGETKILGALYQQHDGYTFTELKKITGLSSPSLSAYLKSLQGELVISKNAETNRYQISEAYVPSDILTKKWGYDTKTATIAKFIGGGGALYLGQKIREIEDETKRQEKYRKFVAAYYDLTSFSIWALIHEAAKTAPKSEGEDPYEKLPPFKDFMFDYFLPLIKNLWMIDVDLWSNHHVIDQIIEEKGKEFDKNIRVLLFDPHLIPNNHKKRTALKQPVKTG